VIHSAAAPHHRAGRTTSSSPGHELCEQSMELLMPSAITP
jgi:hypothetical protein